MWAIPLMKSAACECRVTGMGRLSGVSWRFQGRWVITGRESQLSSVWTGVVLDQACKQIYLTTVRHSKLANSAADIEMYTQSLISLFESP